jgi:hypothetical protein
MTDREVQYAGARIDALASDVRRCLLLAGAALTGVLAAAALDASLWLPLLGVAAGLVLAAAVRFAQRRGVVDRLALDPAAYRIRAVDRHGRRAAGRRQREMLAARLESLAHGPESYPLVIPERVEMYRGDLEDLIRRLGCAEADMSPPQAVACRRLLTRCAESALYNAHLPAEDLGAALRRIRDGVSKSVPGRRKPTHPTI